MPIKAGDITHVPSNLNWVWPLVEAILPMDYVFFRYWYLTVKYHYVVGSGNRPGWHIDGFLSQDINYIWSDCVPTEFCVQSFELTEDHEKSLVEMQLQACQRHITSAKPNELVRLTPSIVHRAVEGSNTHLRAFVKISCSNKEYNLKGNATNPRLVVPWLNTCERRVYRNHPVGESDE
jgi:hypothetical protein